MCGESIQLPTCITIFDCKTVPCANLGLHRSAECIQQNYQQVTTYVKLSPVKRQTIYTDRNIYKINRSIIIIIIIIIYSSSTINLLFTLSKYIYG